MRDPEPFHLSPEFQWPSGRSPLFEKCTILRTIVDADGREKHFVRFEPSGYDGVVWFVEDEDPPEPWKQGRS